MKTWRANVFLKDAIKTCFIVGISAVIAGDSVAMKEKAQYTVVIKQALKDNSNPIEISKVAIVLCTQQRGITDVNALTNISLGIIAEVESTLNVKIAPVDRLKTMIASFANKYPLQEAFQVVLAKSEELKLNITPIEILKIVVEPFIHARVTSFKGKYQLKAVFQEIITSGIIVSIKPIEILRIVAEPFMPMLPFLRGNTLQLKLLQHF